VSEESGFKRVLPNHDVTLFKCIRNGLNVAHML